MRQQINLYQSVLIDKPEPLRLRQVGLILLLFSVLLALLSLFNCWQMRSAGEQLAVLRQQQARLAEQVATLERQYPERRKSALLEEEIRRTERIFEGQKRLLGYFSVREEGGNEKILNLLDGLARNLLPGVWLRRIQLAGSGRKMVLAGSAMRPEQVPQYLQFLGEKGVLSGQVFSRLKLTRLQERPGQVDFSLGSSDEEQP